jgi:hypothetical protein
MLGENQKLVNIGRKVILEVMTMLVIDCRGIMFWYGLVIETKNVLLCFFILHLVLKINLLSNLKIKYVLVDILFDLFSFKKICC